MRGPTIVDARLPKWADSRRSRSLTGGRKVPGRVGKNKKGDGLLLDAVSDTVEGTAYFLRRPPITRTAPEINAMALPADAGLISGTAVTAKAALPIPIKSNTLPSNLILGSPFDGFVL